MEWTIKKECFIYLPKVLCGSTAMTMLSYVDQSSRVHDS